MDNKPTNYGYKSLFNARGCQISARHPTEKNRFVRLGIGRSNYSPVFQLILDKDDELIRSRSGKGGDVFFGTLSAGVDTLVFQAMANYLEKLAKMTGDESQERGFLISNKVKQPYTPGQRPEFKEAARIGLSRSADGIIQISYEDMAGGQGQCVPKVVTAFGVPDRRTVVVQDEDRNEISRAELSSMLAQAWADNMHALVADNAARWTAPERFDNNRGGSGGGSKGRDEDRGGRTEPARKPVVNYDDDVPY